ncbi:MAG TPA: DNA methyltransferase [Bacillota bacterium]|nr:DNA methyltransferase [Bacillota bacterium]HQE10550.1 DNA methyltransferase [Bacillota bacterium]
MRQEQLSLFPEKGNHSKILTIEQLHHEIAGISKYGRKTACLEFPDPAINIPVYINEFWTSKQRAAHSLHEISYRACFKPQLPRFFIARLTGESDVVYDPFMGRGTTVIEAALLNRVPLGCDINPLSRILTYPRLNLPEISEVEKRLQSIDLKAPQDIREDLLVFYHPDTLKSITNLREYLLKREEHGEMDHADAWIRMVATNRLTGHSSGFFSVYTLPPNQAVSVDSQRKINEKRAQTPPLRDVKAIIMRKSRSLLRKIKKSEAVLLRRIAEKARLLTSSADHTPDIRDDTVHLVVTSPPFLDVVDYQRDNWLRCWFNGIDPGSVNIWHFHKPEDWQEKMTGVFKELKRVLVPGGCVAFEVGEVRGGKILLETLAVPAAIKAGLAPEMVIVNSQSFTKTSNCWGVENLKKGTNTNRIVLLRNPPSG